MTERQNDSTVSSKDVKKKIINSNTDTVKENITSVLLYAFTLATALGFNDLMLSFFERFDYINKRISKAIYVFVMFVITISLAHYFESSPIT
jgi:hypothetical protein